MRSLRSLIALGVIAASLEVARRPEPTRVDARATLMLSVHRGTVVDTFAGAVTDVGSVFGLTGAAVAMAAGGHPALAARTALSGSLAWAVAQGTKTIVERPRPYELGVAERLVSTPAGSSWPSGHSAVAAAMAAAVTPELTRAGRVGAAAVAGTVALTRLHVGVHHLSDVAAGAAMGVLCADVVNVLVRHRLS